MKTQTSASPNPLSDARTRGDGGVLGWRLAVLDHLIRLGARLFESVGRREATATGRESLLLAVFQDRIARALLLADALRLKFTAAQSPGDETPAAASAASARGETDRESRLEGGRHGRPLGDEREEDDENEDLDDGDGEAPERLDRESWPRFGRDRVDPLLRRPFEEVVAFICDTLGLSPDWLRLSQDAWARGEPIPAPTAATTGAAEKPPRAIDPLSSPPTPEGRSAEAVLRPAPS